MTDSTIDIALLFPELLGTYGDNGNALVLARRLELRGIAANVITVGVREAVPRNAHVYLLGGGEDAPQFTALEALRASGALQTAIEGGAALLAVCAGLQLIGTELSGPEGKRAPGLGLVDAITTRAAKRLVGEVEVRDELLGTGRLVGFENHRGVTAPGGSARVIGPRHPKRGEATEGVVHGRIIGTYLHGPVLARNPRLADRLIEPITGPLSTLHDREADLLHEERRTAIHRHRTR